MGNRIIMPDAESLRFLIELTKENPTAAFVILTATQIDMINKLTKETEGAE